MRQLLGNVICAMVVISASTAFADNPPKEGTYYKHDALGIQQKEVLGTRLKVTFQPKDEQFFWCPGIKVETTKKAVVVTFVRCKTSKSCGVDVQAKIGKKLVRTVHIETSGLDVYVRNGAKHFKRLYKSPTSKLTSGTKPKTGGRKSTGQSASTSRPERAIYLRPATTYVRKREVINQWLPRPQSTEWSP